MPPCIPSSESKCIGVAFFETSLAWSALGAGGLAKLTEKKKESRQKIQVFIAILFIIIILDAGDYSGGSLAVQKKSQNFFS